MAEENLAVKYLEYVDNPENKGKTFDDFFDWVEIEPKLRKDFLVASILKNAREIVLKEEEMSKPVSDGPSEGD